MLWLYEGCGSDKLREAVFTDGRAEIIINLRHDAYTIFEGEPKRASEFNEIVFCGPHTDSYLLDISTSFQLMGVIFKSFGAAPFLSIPVSEVFGLRLAGDALWGPNFGLIREQLNEAKSSKAKFQALQAVLLKWLERGSAAAPIHPAVTYALKEMHRAPHASTIEKIREHVSFSPRHFINLFRDTVGMSPKVYARVQRFQAALHGIDHIEMVDWATVAFDCGFYDQSHFIREFKTFTGLRPTEYVAARRKHLEYIPKDMRQFFTIRTHSR